MNNLKIILRTPTPALRFGLMCAKHGAKEKKIIANKMEEHEPAELNKLLEQFYAENSENDLLTSSSLHNNEFFASHLNEQIKKHAP